MLIFAYGSNMLRSRLLNRISSARNVGNAFLKSHRLLFNKRGDDRSAKANAWCTGKQADGVWGVIWEIDRNQKPILDKIEGLNKGYGEKYETVRMENGEMVKVQLYVAMKSWVDYNLKPFDWYWHFVIMGAVENKLPESYVKQMLKIEPMIDADQERVLKNRRILERCTCTNAAGQITQSLNLQISK